MAIAAILFYWIKMKVVQQLTCLTLGRLNGPALSTAPGHWLSTVVTRLYDGLVYTATLHSHLFLGSQQATKMFGLLLKVDQTLHGRRSSITGWRLVTAEPVLLLQQLLLLFTSLTSAHIATLQLTVGRFTFVHVFAQRRRPADRKIQCVSTQLDRNN